MQNKIYILGAGGMAREVYEIYRDLGKQERVEAFIATQASKAPGVEIPLRVIKNVPNEENIVLANGIGSPARKKWIEELLGEGFKFDQVIHPTAVIAKNAILGNDIIISASTVITVNVKLGDHSIVNLGVTISHDSQIGNYVTLSPGSHIGGRVRIGEGVFVGIGSNIIQDVNIGSNVFIGAGSVVVNDIPSNSLAYGNPAKVIRKLSEKDWKNLI